MTHLLLSLLSAVTRGIFAILFAGCQSLIGWLAWLLWPSLLITGLLGLVSGTAQPAQAGWTDWLWARPDTSQIERSAELAQNAARVAAQAVATQAEQAAAQATQNARLAETLGQLSRERQEYAQLLDSFAAIAMRDSQWAAALTAVGPIAVCLSVLGLAALAVWMTTRASPEAVTSDGDVRPVSLDLALDLLSTQPRLAAAQTPRLLPPSATPSGRTEPDGLDEEGCPF